MVLQATGRRFGVHLTLTKRIPVQAGLGGGSSDAAAALILVNQLAGGPVPSHELLQFAARLGSDVPFFLSEARLALAWGHGERMLRLPPLPARAGPPAGAARRGCRPRRRTPGSTRGETRTKRGGLALDLDALRGWGDIARMAGNDFEAALFARKPEPQGRVRGAGGHAPAALPPDRFRLGVPGRVPDGRPIAPTRR